MSKEVYIVDAKRTPQVKAGLQFKEISAPHLGAYLVRNLLDGTSIGNDEIDEVIFGNAGGPVNYPNVSRVITLYAGLDKKTSAYTVHRNCASGMEAISGGVDKIRSGRSSIVIAGGVENMSQAPLIYNKDMTKLFTSLMKAKTLAEKIRVVALLDFPI